MPAPQAIAIGIDAAEPSLLRSMMDAGHMPALKRLADENGWSCVSSPSDIGSGAVWPSFVTGLPATEHGVYSHRPWHPEEMRLAPVDVSHLHPFWTKAPFDGKRVIVLDVPFLPPGSPLEILEWGTHDRILPGPSITPSLQRHVEAVGKHPYSRRPTMEWLPMDDRGRGSLVRLSKLGLRQHGELMARLIEEEAPDVLIGVFSEFHRSSHTMWDTVDGRPSGARLRDSMRQVAVELDRQLGRVIATAGPQTRVMVFSLHGMKPANGTPTLLGPLLEAAGYQYAGERTQATLPPRKRAEELVRRAIPRDVKHLVHRLLPEDVGEGLRVPGPPIPDLDWSRTRAFEVYADQHAWIRLNVRGREAQGIVDPEDYDSLCAEIEEWMGCLRNGHGKPVVTRVFRANPTRDKAMTSMLPDVIAHWDFEGMLGTIAVNGKPVNSPPVDKNITGQHAPDGFVVLRNPPEAMSPAGTVCTEDLHRLLA
jgi:predicted AlkP superfamily phosphohydrolase/phosphomutase